MSELNRDLASVWIDRLRDWKKRHGSIPDALVAEASEALERHPKSIRRLVREGLPGKQGRPRKPLTNEEISAYFRAYGDCARAIELIRDEGGNPPNIRRFQRAVKRDLDAMERAHARGGPREARGYRLYLERNEEGRGLCLEADHKVVDVLVAPPRNAALIRPRVTVFLETKTRAIASVCISLTPSEGEILCAYAAAIEHNPDFSPAYGIPEFLRIDNGLDFLAGGVTGGAISLGTQVFQTNSYSPNEKGKVERFFGTFDRECCSKMPCYLNGPRGKNGKLSGPANDTPLTIEEFISEVIDWCKAYNFDRPHSSLNGLTPAQAWDEDTHPIRKASEEDVFRFTLKLVKGDGTRKVATRGVRVFNRYYIAPELERYIGDKVEVRSLPHDERKVEVFVDGKHLCTAQPHNLMSGRRRDEVIDNRQKHAQTAGSRAAKATKDSRRRYRGRTDKGALEETTVVDATTEERAASNRRKGLMDHLGMSNRRGRTRPGNNKGKR